MIQEILINGTNASISINSSNSTNITIRLINELQAMNLSAKIENSSPWYYSPLASTIAGVILGATITFLLTWFSSHKQKKDELKEYEYGLLADTLVFLNSTQLSDKLIKRIEDFLDKISHDPKSNQISLFSLIINSLYKLIYKESFSSEKETIQKRFDELKKYKPKF